MPKAHRPALPPLIIPPATTSANIRNVTLVHNPVGTPVPIAPQKDSNPSNNHTLPKTPQIFDPIPLTPVPAHTDRSKKVVNRRYPNNGTPRTSRFTGQDLEHQAAARNILGMDRKKNGKRWDSKAGIVAACVGAALGTVGLIVYFVVLKAKGEIGD